MSKVYTHFNTKQAQKTILYRLYEGVSLPPPPPPPLHEPRLWKPVGFQ